MPTSKTMPPSLGNQNGKVFPPIQFSIPAVLFCRALKWKGEMVNIECMQLACLMTITEAEDITLIGGAEKQDYFSMMSPCWT